MCSFKYLKRRVGDSNAAVRQTGIFWHYRRQMTMGRRSSSIPGDSRWVRRDYICALLATPQHVVDEMQVAGSQSGVDRQHRACDPRGGWRGQEQNGVRPLHRHAQPAEWVEWMHLVVQRRVGSEAMVPGGGADRAGRHHIGANAAAPLLYRDGLGEGDQP